MSINILKLMNDFNFMTDGGLETSLIFHKEIDLPEFASFPLVSDEEGRSILIDYYLSYLKVAQELGLGFIFEAPTWRASKDWGKKLGYTEEQLAWINKTAIELMRSIKTSESYDKPVLISGCIGPRSDGYRPEFMMDKKAAENYHRPQVKTLSQAGVDLITAMTITYPEEGIGIVKAAQSHSTPVVISITPETDGRLISGHSLEAMIERIDEATNDYVSYYMINCAHPTHFKSNIEVSGNAHWVKRIRGVRANASCASHEELDESTELDDGNPNEFAQDYALLKKLLPNLSVVGGCCGTDLRHVKAASGCLI